MNRRFTLILLFLLLFCSFSTMTAASRDVRLAVERLSDWTPPPPVGGVWHADARVSVFYGDGRFAVINATLGRSQQGRVYVILGEGYSVFSGCWTASGRSINTGATPVYLPGRVEPMPQPVTRVYRVDRSGFPRARGVMEPGAGALGVETIRNSGECLKVAESRTKEFESTSRSPVWPCGKP
jgi:hypothetical protein